MTGIPRPRVLLIEDQEDDILFMKRALSKICSSIDLQIARDGEEAVRMLSEGDGAGLPQRVILDLKLPRRPGLEVLAWMRRHPQLKTVPVTIMSSSAEPSDIRRAESLGIDEYVVKPVTYQDLLDTVGRLCSRWGLRSEPPRSAGRQE